MRFQALNEDLVDLKLTLHFILHESVSFKIFRPDYVRKLIIKRPDDVKKLIRN